MKPDWEDAPSEATHLAQDLNGKWHWFSLEPICWSLNWLPPMPYNPYWDAGQGLRNMDWTDTLEKRPKQ